MELIFSSERYELSKTHGPDTKEEGKNGHNIGQWLSLQQFGTYFNLNILSIFSSVAESCLTLWDAMNRSMPASLSITNSWSLPKLMSIDSVMSSNHFILCHPLLLPSIVPNIRVFSNESALRISWPKYWSFSFSISPSKAYPGLISFRMDWLDLLAVQGTLKSLLQQHS